MKLSSHGNNKSPFLKVKYQHGVIGIKSLGNVLTSGNSAFAIAGTMAESVLTIDANIDANEYIDFAGHKFTFVPGNPTKDGEVKIDATTHETARNLATAILASKSKALKAYSIDVGGPYVVIKQLSASANRIPINVANAANITNTTMVSGTTGGLELSGIDDITGFINTPTATFSVVERVAGINARTEALKYNHVAAQAATAHALDVTAIYTVTIASKVFNGAVYLPRGTATVNNLQAHFVHADTGEKFIATFGPANGNSLSAGANITAIATHLTDLFATTTFNQTRVLEINTDFGDVFNNNGEFLASLKGMVVCLTEVTP